MTEAGKRKGRSADDRSIVSAANAKNGKSQESSFFLRLSAISCLLSYMCFRLKETAVAVRPSADASASMIQSPGWLLSPV